MRNVVATTNGSAPLVYAGSAASASLLAVGVLATQF